MSWTASAYVRKLRLAPNGQAITAAEKLVLYTLADCHNTDQRMAWPSVPTLAADSLMSDRNCKRILHSLEAKTIIRAVHPENQGRGQKTAYLIVALDCTEEQKGDNMSPFPATQKGDKSAPDLTKKGDTQRTKGCHPASRNKEEPPVTSNEPPGNRGSSASPPTPEGPSRATRVEDLVKRAWEFRNKAQQCPWDGRSESVLAKFLRKVPDWPDEQIRTCLVNWCKSENGSPSQDPLYLIPDLPRYLAGPLDQRGRLKASTDGDRSKAAVSTQHNVDSTRRAAEILVGRRAKAANGGDGTS